MANLIHIGSGNATPKGFFDTPRSLYMAEADRLYGKLSIREGNSAPGALNMMSRLSAVVQSTKGYEVDQLWTKLEKEFNKGDTIAHKGKTGGEELQTILGFMYNSLNVMDRSEANSLQWTEFQSMWRDTSDHIIAKFASKLSSKDKSLLSRGLDVVDARLDKVLKNFNDRVDKGELPGPKIST